MIDFGELLDKFDDEVPIFPKSIFESNIRSGKFSYLRGDQEKILEQWFQNRDNKDSIIKMNTGGGKTTVGLLQLQSSLNEQKGPALYLCLDNQLTQQVIRDANELGIKCVELPSDNSFPVDFLNGEAILVTTFQKLFNAKSIFGIQGDSSRDVIDIGAIVIDDAHAALIKARECFTLKLNNGNKHYNELKTLFKDALVQQARGSAEDILEGKDKYGILMVPYWSWIEKIPEVTRLLGNHDNLDLEMKFKWSLVRDYLEHYFALVSYNSIELVPKCLPIHMITSYAKAERRIFMSATLNDDSSLIKDFDINIESVLKPLQSDTFSDIGEKLILAPFNVDSDLSPKRWIQILKAIKSFNVVSLVSSDKQAKLWIDNGFVKPTPNEILQTIDQLHKTSGKHIVLSNRYDGIDLADNSCRILVLDGIPPATSLMERYCIFSRPNSRFMQMNQAQKIEQGLGRAVRSVNDYVIVFLLGKDLVSKTSTKAFQEFMSPQTVNQIKLGGKIVEMLKSSGKDSVAAIGQAMIQVLNRDTSWIQLHKKQISKAVRPEINRLLFQSAQIERHAFNQALSGQYLNAGEHIRQNLNSLPNEDEGWFLQLAASYMYKVDRAKAMELQLAAHKQNPFLLKPPEGIMYKKLIQKATSQAEAVKEFLIQFSESNSVILKISIILDDLIFEQDSSTTFEKAFSDLGNCIGFDSHQPEYEYDVGPDVLWNLYNDEYLVIEAKNEVKLNRQEIYKSETEQISEAINWFEVEYKGKKGIPILVHPATKLHREAFGPGNLVILDNQGLDLLKQNVRAFFVKIASTPLENWNTRDLANELSNHRLDTKSIKSYFSDKQN